MSVKFSRFVDVKGQSELFGSNADGKSLFSESHKCEVLMSLMHKYMSRALIESTG